MVRTLITPAGWAFSIWGALYFGGIVFAIYQALPAQRSSALLDELRWPACGAFLATRSGQPMSSSSISISSRWRSFAFSLVSILTALRRLAHWREPFSYGDRWCAVLPLSALAGWLTAATIVNVAASLRYHGMEAAPTAAPAIAAAVIMFGGVIAGLALSRSRGNPPFAIVFLWALAAIYSAGGHEAHAVAFAAFVAALLTAGGLVFGFRKGGARHWFAKS